MFPPMSHDRLGREVLTASAPIGTLGWLVFVDLPLERGAAAGLRRARTNGVRARRWLVVRGACRRLVGASHGQCRSAHWRPGRRASVVAISTIASKSVPATRCRRLADSFNEMGARLKDFYATLEQKVDRSYPRAFRGTRSVARPHRRQPGDQLDSRVAIAVGDGSLSRLSFGGRRRRSNLYIR